MADASDSKSDVGDNMWVQVPPPAPLELSIADTKVLAIFSFIDIYTANINDL